MKGDKHGIVQLATVVEKFITILNNGLDILN